MKKIITVLFAFIIFFFGSQSLFAADSDYKNNLLKIEVNKLDEDHYDIGLYTQKIYNEPVKIIKKSDTVYYFLLPETSHSITSVTPNDAVKNIVVKSYPYAGQELDNAYTKVAIITSKPLNLSTSLRTLDTSVSPRLDPIRLAKLDKVFERYSERLALNHIPSPLNEFRKTASVPRQSLESNVDVKNKENLIAQNKASSTTSLEDYQNKSNQAQAAMKQQQKTATAAQTQSKTQTAKTQTAVKAQQVQSKPQTSKAQSTAKAQTAVQTQSKTQTAKAQNTAKTQTAVQKTQVQVQNKPQTAAPAAQKVASKPVSQTQKVVSNPAVSTPQQKIAVKKPDSAASSVNTAKEQQTKPSVVPPNKTLNTTEKKQETMPAPPVKTVDVKQDNTAVKNEIIAVKPAAPAPVNVKDEQAKQFEKQLAVKEPVNAEFGKKVPVETINTNKEIKAEVIEPIENLKKAAAPNKLIKIKNAELEDFKLKDAFTVATAIILLAILMYFKNSIAQKNAAKNNPVSSADNSMSDIKEYLKKHSSQKASSAAVQEVADTGEALAAAPLSDAAPSMVPDVVPSAVPTAEIPDISPVISVSNDENAIAFNEYMESISESANVQETENPPLISEEDAVIQQLYTPIEDISYAPYTPSEDSLVSSNADISENAIQADIEEDDVATIVSSSKLTETRGLYLARFEGSTSLVGYIQDDIYVLYNFGEINPQETGIESSLAQESDTDSLYIVKTGGKKLMVKSSPYDMSLEMVM